jgi:hypothetical protein
MALAIAKPKAVLAGRSRQWRSRQFDPQESVHSYEDLPYGKILPARSRRHHDSARKVSGAEERYCGRTYGTSG